MSASKVVPVTAETLAQAWAKYAEAFGEVPHGTVRQLGAMLCFLPAAAPEPVAELGLKIEPMEGFGVKITKEPPAATGPTPRTDANEIRAGDVHEERWVVLADDYRQLERELTAAQAEIARLNSPVLLSDWQKLEARCEAAERKVTNLIAENTELRSAGIDAIFREHAAERKMATVRAETIEECANEMDRCGSYFGNLIRALAEQAKP